VVRPKGLTNRQQLFIEYYLQSWNACDAARKAGFRHADNLGARLVKNPDIKTAIDERMRSIQMQTDEALVRLTQMARGNLADFITIEQIPLNRRGKPVLDSAGNPVMGETVKVNFQAVRERGYLIKSLTYDRSGNPKLEMYDAQGALVQIGRAHGLFTDRVEDVKTPQVVLYMPDNQRDTPKPELPGEPHE